MPTNGNGVHGCVADGQRFRLPRASVGVDRLHVVGIGEGWCELSEQAPTRRLPLDRVCVDERHRFRLPRAPGYRQRWGCGEDEPILVLASRDPATGGLWVLLLALRHILAGLDVLRPPLCSGRLRAGAAPSAGGTSDELAPVGDPGPPPSTGDPGGSDGR